MDKSFKSLPHMNKSLYIKKKELSFSEPLKRELSVKKPKKYLNLKDLFYQQENTKQNKIIINKDLSILNSILSSTKRLSSIKTAFSYNLSNSINYNLCMINKYEEKYDSNLSFISNFDLEEDNQNIEESFNSSELEDESEEQIISKSSNKKLFDENDEEYNKKLEKEWDEIRDLLLKK